MRSRRTRPSTSDDGWSLPQSDEEGPRRIRLFLAAPVPTELLERLETAVAPHRSSFPGARWTSIANQHVTLKFLGGTDESLLGDITTVCRSIASRHHPAVLSLSSLGSFPSRTRSRVLWIGLEDPRGLLTALASDLDRELARFGFETEARAFTPHLTLCRFKTPTRLPDGPPEIALEHPDFDVSNFVLYQSHLSPKGARYEERERFVLGGS